MKKLLAQRHTFQKFKSVAHKNRTEKPGKMVWSQSYIKIFGVHFVSSILGNNNWGYNK